MKCPPCTHDCEQGDFCPSRIEHGRHRHMPSLTRLLVSGTPDERAVFRAGAWFLTALVLAIAGAAALY